MSHAFRSQTRSPQPAILSKTKSVCQEESPLLRLTQLQPPPTRPKARAALPRVRTRRYRFTERVRTQRAARLCELAIELPTDERAILLSRYADGRSSTQIAAIAGCTRHHIERKLRVLTKRLARPEYVFLAPRLARLDPEQRAIARACIIQGLSIRSAAAQLNMSQHALRERRSVLLAMVRGLASPPPVTVLHVERPPPLPARQATRF